MFTVQGLRAQTTMRDAFLQMPDSVIPYLTHEQRLDLLDYLDAGMTAEVTNELQGRTLLESLSADSLVLHLNESHILTIYLLDAETEIDSSRQVIVVSHEYRLSTGEFDRTLSFYSHRWSPLTHTPALSASLFARIKRPENTLLRRDDEILSREPLSQQ